VHFVRMFTTLRKRWRIHQTSWVWQETAIVNFCHTDFNVIWIISKVPVVWTDFNMLTWRHQRLTERWVESKGVFLTVTSLRGICVWSIILLILINSKIWESVTVMYIVAIFMLRRFSMAFRCRRWRVKLYTGWAKKVGHRFMTIILLNRNRF